jgi:hypothetical protein
MTEYDPEVSPVNHLSYPLSFECEPVVVDAVTLRAVDELVCNKRTNEHLQVTSYLFKN